jgi:hypothetical protein
MVTPCIRKVFFNIVLIPLNTALIEPQVMGPLCRYFFFFLFFFFLPSMVILEFVLFHFAIPILIQQKFMDLLRMW